MTDWWAGYCVGVVVGVIWLLLMQSILRDKVVNHD